MEVIPRLLIILEIGIIRCCEGEPCPAVGGFPGLLDAETDSNETGVDVSAIKRSAPLSSKSLQDRQNECRFFPSGGTFNSRGAQQQLPISLDCPAGGSGCSLERTTSITIEATDSFGTEAGTGINFYDILQADVTFSETYSFSEANTVSELVSFSVPPGASGFGTWTPFVECVDGTWRGNCQGWRVDQPGRACIPQQPEPRGVYGFVQTN